MALLVALALVGCQSGGQSDLVTRELRMQEDQIYAMEDYLAEYQQLLCQVRAENAALKRQIAEMNRDGELPQPSDRSEPTQRNRRRPARGPEFQSPERKAPQGAPPPTPETELIDPGVPPLNGTTSIGERERSLTEGAGSPRSGKVWIVRGQSPDDEIVSPVDAVQIRGEVVANDTGGGPRMAIQIIPLSAAATPARFEGAVSLMLLAPQADGSSQCLARWDYSATDVQTLVAESLARDRMEFHLELPAGTPTDVGTEFWVRLIRPEGGKVLEHVPVDLRQPGTFGALPEVDARPTKPRDKARDNWNARQPAGDEPESPHASEQVSDFAYSARGMEKKAVEFSAGVGCSIAKRRDDEGWSVARPDRPGQTGVAGEEVGAAWRAASGPIPVVVESVAVTAPPRAARPVVQQAAFIETVEESTRSAPSAPVARPEKPAIPKWTAERGTATAATGELPSESSRTSTAMGLGAPARPVWSPLR